MKRFCLLFCLPLLLPACTGVKEKGDSYAEELFTVDLQKKYPVKEVVLQDVAEVEYIPLATSNSSLVTSSSFYINDRYIIGSNRMGDIIFFNKDGTFHHSFNKMGNGGKQYRSIFYKMCPDFEREEIYIYDYRPNVRQACIQVYGFDGTYRRTLLLKLDTYLKYLVNYDSNTLFAQDDYGVYNSTSYSKTPFYKISKQDGRVDSLPIRMEERMNSTMSVPIRISETETDKVLVTFPFVTFSKMGDRIVLSDFAQDTVYTYESDRLSPFLVKKNRLKGENTMMLNVDFISDRYVLMSVQEKAEINFNTFPDIVPLWYDRKDNSLSQVKLMNADGVSQEASEELLIGYSGYSLTATSRGLLPDKCALQIYPASFLLELNEEGKLTGRLKEIASNLKIEDNPILMLVKFKE